MGIKFQKEPVTIAILYLMFSAFCYFFVSESLAFLLIGVGLVLVTVLNLPISQLDLEEDPIEPEFKQCQQVYDFVENFTGEVRNKNQILNANGEEFYLILAEDGLMKISKAENLRASSLHGGL